MNVEPKDFQLNLRTAMAQVAKYLLKSPWFPNLYTCLNESAVTGLSHVIENLPHNGITQWLEDLRSSVPVCEYRPIFLIAPVLAAMLVSTAYTLFTTGGIKIYSMKLKSDVSNSMKQLSTFWICLNSVLTIGVGAFTIRNENNFFFFHPSTSFLYWDTCAASSELVETLLFLRMGFHLHSFLMLLLDSVEEKIMFHIKVLSHLGLFGLLAVTHLLGFFEPIVVLLLLFEVREILWRLIEHGLQNNGRGQLSLVGTIALAVCMPYQSVCIVYWLITKFIYFFAVIYSVKSETKPFYLLILSLFLVVLATEVWRLFAMVITCFKKIRHAQWRKQEDQSEHKKQD